MFLYLFLQKHGHLEVEGGGKRVSGKVMEKEMGVLEYWERISGRKTKRKHK